MALRPTSEAAQTTPDPAAVPSSAWVDCGTRFGGGAGRRLSLWKTGRPPGLSDLRAALYFDPGRRASSCDPLDPVAARLARADDLAISRRTRKQRPLADDGGRPALEGVRGFAYRRSDADDVGSVWGERGGNEFPESGS
jgi:hypothetical protein